jgi:putative transposase
VIMPNHLHAVVVLGDADGAMHPGRAATRAAPTQEFGTTPTLATIIGTYKSITTLRYTRGVDAGYWGGFRNRLWQRGYHEEVLRKGASWAAVRRYIADNPAQWADDREHPGRGLVGAVREAGRS